MNSKIKAWCEEWKKKSNRLISMTSTENEHQRRIYEDFVFNDLSLGEIANEEGISRQGVHDMIKRCTKSLEGYEEKLHLIAKFQSAKQKVAQIDALAKEFHSSHNEAIMEEIEQISNQILEEL